MTLHFLNFLVDLLVLVYDLLEMKLRGSAWERRDRLERLGVDSGGLTIDGREAIVEFHVVDRYHQELLF